MAIRDSGIAAPLPAVGIGAEAGGGGEASGTGGRAVGEGLAGTGGSSGGAAGTRGSAQGGRGGTAGGSGVGGIKGGGGIIGQWHLDGDAVDSSGNGHNGVVVGATPTSGRLGLAYHFDGSAAIDVGNLQFSNGTYTVSLWARTDLPAVVDDYRMVIGKPDSGSNPFEIFLGCGKAPLGGGGDSLQYVVWVSGVTIINTALDRSTWNLNARDGAWHMVVVTYEPGMQTLFVDGALVVTQTYFGAIPTTTNDVLIGGSEFGPYHHPWIGDIDEVTIYNRPLSAPEVLALYQSY